MFESLDVICYLLKTVAVRKLKIETLTNRSFNFDGGFGHMKTNLLIAHINYILINYSLDYLFLRINMKEKNKKVKNQVSSV